MTDASATNAPRGFAGLMARVTVLPTEDANPKTQNDMAVPSASPLGGRDSSPRLPFSGVHEPERSDAPPSARSRQKISPAAVVTVLSIFGLIVLLASANRKNASAPTPTISNSMPRDYPSPSPAVTPIPLDTKEIMPPVGSGLSLTRANVRYCQFMHQRIEIARGLIANDSSDDFNRAVDDFNSRCSSFRYIPDDLTAVQAEVAVRQSQFGTEARALVSSWTGGPNPQPSSGANPIHSSPTTAPAIPATPLDAVIRRPTVIAQIPVAPAPSTTPMAASLPPPLDIAPRNYSTIVAGDDTLTVADLLNEDEVKRIQRRLMELGFFKGPANGTWGPMSRVAFRNFKFANGLANNDRLDDTGHARLMSPTAIVAGPASSVAPAGGPEYFYPPPPGGRRNPLNAADAAQINGRLRTLGYFSGKSDTLWSGASRAALKAFKQKLGLGVDSRWDATSEAALFGSSD